MNDRDNLLKQYERTKDPADWVMYKRLRKETNRGVREAKQEFTLDNLEKHVGDHNKFWQQINELIPKSDSNRATLRLVDKNDNSEVDVSKTADYINSFFVNIGPNLARLFTEPWVTDMARTNMELPSMVTNEDEVKKLVKEINIYKSSAIKNLSSKLLKPAFLVIIPQLTHLFNLCLQLGIFPESWKTATVIPLKKDGDKSDVGNLRPISLLPLPGKLLERVIAI